jgi:hypothetical protein
MSDGGWIPRIAGDEPSDTDGFGYCGYLPPSYGPNRTPRWQFPAPSVVVSDVEARGGQIEILVEDILQAYKGRVWEQITSRTYKILLGALVLHLRSDSKVSSAWDQLRKSAEITACVAAEARMDQMIERDEYKAQAPALIKFKLERRDYRFSKNSKPVDENEEAAIKEMQRLMEQQASGKA